MQVFRPSTAREAIDLVSQLLEYTPAKRLSAIEGMIHEFFDELRTEGVRMPNGREFPRLFDFTREGTSRRLGSGDHATHLLFFALPLAEKYARD